MDVKDERFQYGTIPEVIYGLKNRFMAQIVTRAERNFISQKCKMLRDDREHIDPRISFEWGSTRGNKMIVTILFDTWNCVFYCDATEEVSPYVSHSGTDILYQ